MKLTHKAQKRKSSDKHFNLNCETQNTRFDNLQFHLLDLVMSMTMITFFLT